MFKKITALILSSLVVLALIGCTHTSQPTTTTVPENEIYYAGTERHPYLVNGRQLNRYEFYFNYYHTKLQNWDYGYTRLRIDEKKHDNEYCNAYNGIFYGLYDYDVPNYIVPNSTLSISYFISESIEEPKIDMDFIIHVELVRFGKIKDISNNREKIVLQSKDFRVGDLMKEFIVYED